MSFTGLERCSPLFKRIELRGQRQHTTASRLRPGFPQMAQHFITFLVNRELLGGGFKDLSNTLATLVCCHNQNGVKMVSKILYFYPNPWGK